MFGTMVVAGPTTDEICVLIPDSTTSTVDDVSPAGLQHVVGLSLGSAENLNSTLPQDELHLALCDNSLRPNLTVGRQDYWTEITLARSHPYSGNGSVCMMLRVHTAIASSHYFYSHTAAGRGTPRRSITQSFSCFAVRTVSTAAVPYAVRQLPVRNYNHLWNLYLLIN